MMKLHKSVTRQKDKGQGLTEFALVIPILLLLVLGIIEFGHLLFVYSAVSAASREAARYGSAVHDTGGGVKQYEDCAGIREAAKRVGSLAGIQDGDITIEYDDGSTVYDTSCPPTQHVYIADRITVKITTDFRPLVPLVNLPPIPITSTTSRTILKGVVPKEESGSGNPNVRFTSSAQSVVETIGSVTVVAKLSETTSNAVSVPFTVSGSATGGGTDYTMTSSPLTIPAGSTTATITINILDDGISEGSETIVIDMGTPTNADKGIPSSHTVTITDNISVSFGDPSPSNYITEAVDTETEVTISVDLSEVSEDDITVPFSLGGSASEGEGLDYTISPDSQVIIPAGSLSSVITFTILDDIETEELEYLKLTMGEPNNDAVKGSPSERTIFIQDNEISHCDISSVSFAMGTDSITWSLKNNGEAVLFTRGIITWPAASPNAPRLDWIQFRGVTVHDANESPGTLDYDASPMVSFIFEDTQPLLLQFNSALGSGDYFISAYFENQDAAGYTCSVEYTIVNYIP